jgi:uncharacterized membrane protein YfcA
VEPLSLAILTATALATSVVSGMLGLAGGMILLAVLLLFLEPLVAIPLHGVIQLVSNSSRAWIQRSHVQPAIVLRYALPLLPLGFAGLALAERLPARALEAGIGVFVILATWRPAWLLLGRHPEQTHPTRRFLWLGALVGFLNPIVGGTGPLLAPFFLKLGLARQAVVGTMAACQSLGHLAKIAVFGAAGFAFREHVALLALLSAAAVVGTWLGTRLLDRLDDRRFEFVYKSVLTLIAVRLVVGEGWRILVR